MSLLFKQRQGASDRHLPLWQRLINYLLRHLQQATGSLGELWQAPLASIMTIAVIGVSLTLPATLYVLVKNTAGISDEWQHASQISLYLHAKAEPRQIQALMTRLQQRPEIASLRLIDKQQALADFKQQAGFAEALALLPQNPLPDVIVVQPSQRHSSAMAAREPRDSLQQEALVEHAALDIDWLQRLDALMALIRDVLLVTGSVLCLAVVLIVGNTLRLAIMNRREAIEVMKLVGATDAFIQRPFLYTGLWYGFFGGLVALLLIAAMLWWLEGAIVELTRLYQSSFSLQGLSAGESLLLVAIAMLLALLAALITVARHIRAINPD